MIDIKYQNALTEVDEILNSTDEELISKIPSSVKKFIKENKNVEYNVKIDNTKTLEEQSILPETQAMLALIYRSYWATEEEKKEFAINDAAELEYNTEASYTNDIFESKKQLRKDENKEENIKEKNEVTDLVLVKEEKWYQKVWKKLCNLFRTKN